MNTFLPLRPVAVAAATSLLASISLADTLVPAGATWRVLDNGSDPGTAWRQPGFADGAWAAGPAQLGYGDGDEATTVSYGPSGSSKYITTYFRHTFQVADPADYSGLRLQVQRDDGVAVYLNGTEVFRDNLPGGNLTSTTTASSAVGGSSESVFLQANVDAGLLTVGANVLAVEIHQANPTSSDISFDLRLDGNTGVGTITRGPYLQRATPHAITLRWRTDAASDSRVRYGTDPANLNLAAANAAVTTEHVLTLTGLQADTRYFYDLGNALGWFSGDANDYFVTAPMPGTVKPIRVWVVGDSGTADGNAAAVRNAYLDVAATRPADLWLMLGDNAYDSGTDAEYQAAVFNLYPSVLQNTVLWPTRGNHESDAGGSGSTYYNIYTLPTGGEAGGLASGTEAYYAFDHANVHFICLDSQGSSRSSSGPMATWLRNDLLATTQDWIIAYWHHPPYSKGSHNSDTESQLVEMRANFLPILEAGGVDLVLCGHSHSYERSYLLDGHYGLSSTLTQAMKVDSGDGREDGSGAYQKPAGLAARQGAVYTVAGSSGKTSGGSLNHPAMLVSLNELGSVILDVNGTRLDATFLRANGSVGDYFTIMKDASPPTPPAAPGNLTATPLSDTEIQLAWADHAANEQGFRIERSVDGVTFAVISSVGANVTDGVDTGLTPNTTCWYRVRAFNAAGESADSNVAQATTFEAAVQTVLIPAGAVWRYLDNGTDQGSAWREVAFKDSTWNSGPAQLGYGDGDEATVVSFGPNASSKYVTTYFRQAFTVANPAAYTALRVSLQRDDGAVVYLNGAEVMRDNLPGGAVNYQTSALSAVGGADESAFYDADISVGLLVAGANVMAVEIHQANATSSDISFDLELVATGGGSSVPTPPVAPGDLTATAVSATQIELAWTDQATDEDGFRVDRSTDSVSFSPLATVEANGVSYSDPGLTPNTTYWYRVRAFNAAGESADSNVALATTPTAQPITVTFTSVAAEDGYVLESSESSGSGSSVSSSNNGRAGLRAGDQRKDRQYKTIVSFDTAALPDGVAVASAMLRLKRGTVSGTNPFQTHGACWVDIKTGTGFNDSPALSREDFAAPANAQRVGQLSAASSNGQWSEGDLNAFGRVLINRAGTTQFKVYFELDDNDDRGDDYIGWYPGDNDQADNRPQLVVTYQ